MCFSQTMLRSEMNGAFKQWCRQCSDKVDNNETGKLPIRRPKLNASDRLEKLLKDHEEDVKKVQVITDDEKTKMPPKSPPRWRRRSLSPMMRVQNMMKDKDSEVKEDDKQ